MAWTNPRTWVTAEVVTAALLNAHLRDNLNETAAGKVTTAGDIIYATGANALARLAIGSAGKILRVNAGATAPEWANKSYARVTRGSAYDIPNNAATSVPWDAEDWDSDAMHDPSGGGGTQERIVLAAAGLYHCVAQINFDNANTNGIRYAEIKSSTGLSIALVTVIALNQPGAGFQINLSGDFDAAATNWVYVDVYQNTGTNPYVGLVKNVGSYLSVHRIA